MKILAIPLSLAGLMLALMLGAPLRDRWEQDNNHARALQLIEEQRQQFDLQQYQIEQQATLPGKIATQYGLVILLLVGGGGIFYIVYDGYRQRRTPLVRYDPNNPHVARWMLEQGNQELIDAMLRALELTGQAQVAKAVHQPGQLPASYAPHLTIATPKTGAFDTPQLGAPAVATVPTFAQLLDAGRVGRDNPLLLGFDAESGQELAGTWKDLYSAAIAGVSGSGKTTTVRFLAAQSALHGARWVLLDPHAEAGDDSLAGTLAPLSSTFLCEPATNGRTMLASVQLVADTLDRRLSNKSSDRWPLILAADEFTSLMRGSLAEPLAKLIERIAQEGRKVLVFALVSGQVWTAERTGGSALRDSLASCYVHRMKRRQANHLLQLGDELPETLMLPTGHALLYRTTGELVEVAIPNTTAADVERVGSLLASPRLTLLPNLGQKLAQDMPTVGQTDATDNQAYSAPTSAEALRVVQMFREGMDLSAIVLELRGVRSNEGKRYQVALSDVQALLRQGLRGTA